MTPGHGSQLKGLLSIVNGAYFPVPAVPGLALTAEYRILALTATRTYNAALTGCESK